MRENNRLKKINLHTENINLVLARCFAINAENLAHNYDELSYFIFFRYLKLIERLLFLSGSTFELGYID
jgi:hypothetical protein